MSKFLETSLFTKLNARRRRLAMPFAVVAKRSGVSIACVTRMLSGRNPHASHANVAAVAEALGMKLQLRHALRVDDLRKQEAERKADKLARMLQGTSGLEGQALDKKDLEAVKKQTVHALLGGSRRNLWR